jgi:hypothetical protein
LLRWLEPILDVLWIERQGGPSPDLVVDRRHGRYADGRALAQAIDRAGLRWGDLR